MSGQHVEVIIRRPGHPERRLVLEEGTIHIGRAEDNGLVLPDISVSRRHARVVLDGRSVAVEDAGSGNGTYFRGRPVKRQDISDGDEIVIDPFVLQFSVTEIQEPERTDQAPEAAAPGYDEVGPARPIQARLEVLAGHGLLPEYPITPAGLSMGRGDKRDIVLPDPASSRRHAEVASVGGQWVIRDTGSVNGTFVNGQRIREHLLRNGDRIRIGSTEFRFVVMEVDDRSEPVVHEGTRPFDMPLFTDPAPGGMQAMPAPGTLPPMHNYPAPPPPQAPYSRSPTVPIQSPVQAPLPPPVQAQPAPHYPAQSPVPFQAAPAVPQPAPMAAVPPQAGGFGGYPGANPTIIPGATMVPPEPMQPMSQAAPGGFGAVEMDVNAGKGRRSRKMKTSSSRMSVRPQGSFMERNIRKLILGIAIFAIAMIGLKVVKDGQKDVPKVATAPSSEKKATAATPEDAKNQQLVADRLKEGNELFRSKKYLEAVEKYAEVQKIDPHNPTATKMGYHACEFLVLNALGKEISLRSTTETERKQAYDKAMKDAEEALAGKGVTIAAALDELRSVRDFFPDDKTIPDLIARLEGTARSRTAVAIKKKQEAHEQGIGDLFASAESEARRGDMLAAIAAYQKVLEADPEKQTDFYWKSEEQIRQAKASLSDRAKESFRAGLDAIKAQDYIAARSELRKAVRLDPYNNTASRKLDEVQQKLDEAAQKFWSEAEIYEASNQFDMAIARYRKVVEYSSSPNTSLAGKAQRRIDALMR